MDCAESSAIDTADAVERNPSRKIGSPHASSPAGVVMTAATKYVPAGKPVTLKEPSAAVLVLRMKREAGYHRARSAEKTMTDALLTARARSSVTRPTTLLTRS